ncbi:MAG TPA: hypothetical protein V6D10_14140 [Trichocoleus sp.]
MEILTKGQSIKQCQHVGIPIAFTSWQPQLDSDFPGGTPVILICGVETLE